jgi:hypothetical protein
MKNPEGFLRKLSFSLADGVVETGAAPGKKLQGFAFSGLKNLGLGIRVVKRLIVSGCR